MWPFNKPKIDRNQVRESPALLDLDDRMSRLERVVRDLQTDWAAQYDKFHRLNMRLAKRQKAIEDAEEQPSKTHEDGPEGTNGPEPAPNPLAIRLLQRGWPK